MTIYVDKSGADMNVGVTQKGANGFAFNTDHIDADWERENTWNAWLYALGVTLTEADSFFVKLWLTTPINFVDTGVPNSDMGMCDTAQSTHRISSVMGSFREGTTKIGTLLWEDDGTFHGVSSVVYTYLASTDYYITIVHDAVANTQIVKIYTASDDVLRDTLSISTVGWSWDVDSVGLSAVQSGASTGKYTNQWEITRIKANSGTTEEFAPTGLTSNRIMFIM